MADLVKNFAGKVDGELIRTADWNGLIEAIEEQLGTLSRDLGARLDEVSGQVAALDQRVSELNGQVASLDTLATALRDRMRRIDLSASRTSFAMGERGEIVARVTDIEGNPLNLSRAADRPWVDFVTLWGALKAAPGFTSTGGANDRTISVRVNQSGEARVLIRAEAGAVLAEEQEQEIEAVLATEVSSGLTLGSAIMNAPTPGSNQMRNAFKVVSDAYERTDTLVMRSYLDTYYIRQPGYVLPPVQAITWRDHSATVLAFVKPDDNPTTADGAQAVGSIRVQFRDWIYPWIMVDFAPPPVTLVDDFRDRFVGFVKHDYAVAVNEIYKYVDGLSMETGVIGKTRYLNAAQQALEGLTVENPPTYLADLKETVGGGLVLQRGLLASEAVAPTTVKGASAGKALGVAAAQGQKAAEFSAADMRVETRRAIAEAETSLEGKVSAQVQNLVNQVSEVHQMAETANMQLRDFNVELGKKAGFDMVSKLLTPGR